MGSDFAFFFFLNDGQVLELEGLTSGSLDTVKKLNHRMLLQRFGREVVSQRRKHGSIKEPLDSGPIPTRIDINGSKDTLEDIAQNLGHVEIDPVLAQRFSSLRRRHLSTSSGCCESILFGILDLLCGTQNVGREGGAEMQDVFMEPQLDTENAQDLVVDARSLDLVDDTRSGDGIPSDPVIRHQHVKDRVSQELESLVTGGLRLDGRCMGQCLDQESSVRELVPDRVFDVIQVSKKWIFLEGCSKGVS